MSVVGCLFAGLLLVLTLLFPSLRFRHIDKRFYEHNKVSVRHLIPTSVKFSIHDAEEVDTVTYVLVYKTDLSIMKTKYITTEQI